MNFNIKYKNGYPAIHRGTSSNGTLKDSIIVLNVEGTTGTSRKFALAEYVRHIEFALRDLKVMEDTDIAELNLSNNLFNTYMHSHEEVLDPSQKGMTKITKYDMVFFKFLDEVFKEKLLFTCNGMENSVLDETNVDRDGSYLVYDNHKINKRLLSSKDYKQDLKFIHSLVVTIKTYLPDYDIRLDDERKSLLYVYKGSPLKSIEEIKDTSVFLFFKLIEVLLTKERHYGVYFIDASLLRTDVLMALLCFLKLVYLNEHLIFLYNLSEVKRKKVESQPFEYITLPNHKVPYDLAKKNEKKN